MNEQLIATRTLIVIDQNNIEKEIQIGVGTPREIEELLWACPVALSGLYPQLSNIHGVDSWQALQLAMGFLESLLQGFINDGGRLAWPDTREPYDLRVGKAPNGES